MKAIDVAVAGIRLQEAQFAIDWWDLLGGKWVFDKWFELALVINMILESVGPEGALDFKPPGMRVPTVFGPGGGLQCPTNCDHSVTMCGMCLSHDTPGNFALGFLAGYAGIAPVGSWISRAADPFGDDDADTVAAGEEAGENAREEEDEKRGDPKNARERAICNGLAKLQKQNPKHFKDCPKCPK